MARRALAMAFVMAAVVGLAPAYANPIDDLFGDEDKNWTEVPPEMPAAPVPANLIFFYVSPVTDFRFAVDAKSISIGTDHVVHYTLIAQSPEGARNVTFEGMRCSQREYKVYAYGRSDGTFSARPDAAWARIDEADANRQRASLYKDYFCGNGRPDRVADLVRALQGNPYNSIPK